MNRSVAVAAAVLALAAAGPAAARTWVVNQRHAQADDAGPGTEESPLRTIAPAAAQAGPGDTVLVHEGIYRERVVPARGGEEGRPITYAAAAGETVVLKASEVWRPAWEPVEGQADVYYGRLDPALFKNPLYPSGEYNPYRLVLKGLGEGKRTLGQVFVDGERLAEVESVEALHATPGTWMADEGREGLFVHFGASALRLEDRTVELAVRGRTFAPHARGLGYIHVRGFVMEHAANQHPSGFWTSDSPQAGALGCRGGHHWVIEGNTIRLAKNLGLDCGSEGQRDLEGDQPEPADAGHHLVRGNVISDNGCGGIAAYRSTGTRIIGNRIERNNALGFRTWEVAGIKTHYFFEGLIEGNLVRDNDCFGIWLDNRYRNARVTRNLVLNNYLAGIFVELGVGPVLVDTNVVAFTRGGDGLYSHDASGVTLAHNLLYGNGHFGAYLCVATDRRTSGGLTQSSHHRVLNNLVLGNQAGAVSLPFPFERAADNTSDFNVLMGGGETMDESTGAAAPLFLYNTSHKHVKMETIRGAFAEALERAAVPAEARPNLERWVRNPALGLEEWRVLSGCDAASRTVRLRHDMLAAIALELDVVLDGTLEEMACPRVEGTDVDLFGAALPAEKPLPGPFQNLRAGRNHLVLWPVPEVERGALGASWWE